MGSATRIGEAAAALPEEQRAERERPFWLELTRRRGWQRLADAGCGGGFHRRLLAKLGLQVVGFDRALVPLAPQRPGLVLAADVAAPALRPASFDGVLCLGNTVSLLPDRGAQRQALAALAALLRPGGLLVVQAEDAGVTAASGARLRARAVAGGGIHVRAYERRGHRVRMLVGVVQPGEDAAAEAVWLLPTSAARLAALARPFGLRETLLPPPPAGPEASWWLALETGPGGTTTRPDPPKG
ncbi:MAG TPA: methyltransferase domain-containing protein [Thermoanaerobaculaceae bacterium]|nr:methyltransferase domain-containing protein [Thermoanaerobaculaceae bacterium]HRS17246.1 methyltransferase domain-containing protein [Thermoanaerobaculaceae bacterium]